MSVTSRGLVWLTALLAVFGYGFHFLAGFSFKHFGVDLDGAEHFADRVRPFSYLMVIAAVILWFPAQTVFKRLLELGLFVAAAVVISQHLSWGFTSSFPALIITSLGLAVMFSLPKMELWKKVFIGFVIGVLLGFELKVLGVPAFSEYLKIFGSIFIDLIMMIVVPLIFFALVSGINNMSDNALGRVGTKAVAIYILSAMLAIALGLVIANIFNPGVGMNIRSLTAGSIDSKFQLPKLVQVLLYFIPHNAIGAMAGAEGKPQIVQTVFIAIFVGVTLNLMGEQGKRIVEFSQSAAQLMFKMIGYIIKLAPLAVFGLMAWITTNFGIDTIIQLMGLVVCTISAMGVHLVILALMIAILGRLNPIPFFMKSREYQMLAFSTSSSKATLGVAMKVAEEKVGVSRASTSFVLPLGAAINMDGTAIYLGICAIFFAQAFGVHLEFHHYVLIIFTATIASIGAAGYPGGSLVMMPMVLSAIDLSPENITLGIALLAGVDRILDMFRTLVNVTSDVALTTIIDRSEGTFNEQRYYMNNAELAAAI